MYKINLLPPEMIPARKKRRRAEQLPGLAWRAGAAVLVIGYGMFLFVLWSAQADLDGKRRALERLYPELAAVRELRDERAAAEDKLAVWRDVFLGRPDWVKVVDDVNAAVPDTVWFTALAVVPAEADTGSGDGGLPPRPDTLRIEGAGRSLPAVGALVQGLYYMPHFNEVTLQEVREDSDGNLRFIINAELVGSNEHVAETE